MGNEESVGKVVVEDLRAGEKHRRESTKRSRDIRGHKNKRKETEEKG